MGTEDPFNAKNCVIPHWIHFYTSIHPPNLILTELKTIYENVLEKNRTAFQNSINRNYQLPLNKCKYYKQQRRMKMRRVVVTVQK